MDVHQKWANCLRRPDQILIWWWWLKCSIMLIRWVHYGVIFMFQFLCVPVHKWRFPIWQPACDYVFVIVSFVLTQVNSGYATFFQDNFIIIIISFPFPARHHCWYHTPLQPCLIYLDLIKVKFSNNSITGVLYFFCWWVSSVPVQFTIIIVLK